MTPLKYCPFCGKSGVGVKSKVVPRTRGEKYNYYVVCNYCKARGSISRDMNKAVEMWNTRILKEAKMFWNYLAGGFGSFELICAFFCSLKTFIE